MRFYCPSLLKPANRRCQAGSRCRRASKVCRHYRRLAACLQAAELMAQWAPIDVADALELLSPDFQNEEVRAGGTMQHATCGFSAWRAREPREARSSGDDGWRPGLSAALGREFDAARGFVALAICVAPS